MGCKSIQKKSNLKVIVERLSARQLILHRISEIVCMYARTLRANVRARAPV